MTQRTAIAPVINDFHYAGVELLPSRLATLVDGAIATYGERLAVDDVLKGFRRKAGLDAPGNDLGGWAKGTTEATFGQWLSGLARLAHVRGDAALRQRAIDLADGWIATAPNGNANMGTYGFEKLMCGLLDVARYADHPPALEALTQAIDWASRTFDRSRTPATPDDRDGRTPKGTLEWYTLAENSYRAYQLTGDARFREFAALWHYDTYWDAFFEAPAAGDPWDVPVWLHAYSHVNTFAGAAAAWEVTGDERFLTIVRNAWRWLTETQTYATGGFGPGEWTLPDDGTLGRSVEWRSDTAEIPCGTWAAFKLTSYLMRATGEAQYMEWAERLLYNGIGASLPTEDDGHHYYYGDYRLGAATKLHHWDQWACCSGTYLQDIAHIANLIYYTDDTGPYVALFVPSRLTWNQDGVPITLRQDTGFPNIDTSTITIEGDAPAAFTLHIRVPAWSRGLECRINGKVVEGAVSARGWLEIERTWTPSDVITIALGAYLHALPIDRFHPGRVALAHGPVVLAQTAVFSMPFAMRGDPTPDALAAMFRRKDEGAGWAGRMVYEPLDRGAREQPVGIFRPLWDFGWRVPHRVYHDLDAPRFI